LVAILINGFYAFVWNLQYTSNERLRQYSYWLR
jgi:hypothetical protein